MTRFRDNEIVQVSTTSSSYAETIISSNERRKADIINLSWISSTSNNAERLFSKAKRVMGDHRQKLNPANFESQIFLMANKKYWSVCDVQSISLSLLYYQKKFFHLENRIKHFHAKIIFE